MSSISTEANHLGFNKPFSYLLVRCNLSRRHNRNSNGSSNGIFMHPND